MRGIYFAMAAAMAGQIAVEAAAAEPKVVPARKVIIDNRFIGAFDVITVDMDGDGDVDAVGAARESASIGWWENDGKAAFTRREISGLFAMNGPRTVAAADFDGDGDMDVAGAALEGGEVSWWVNLGNHKFEKRVIAAPGSLPGARAMRAADVDGDGDIDIICAASEADEIVWFGNDGKGAFTRHTVTGAGAFDGPYWLAVADMDKDGKIDVVAVARNAGEAAWYRNDGKGVFTKREITGAKAIDGPRAVDVGDMDGDGDLDVVTAAGEGDDISWWENDRGSFTRRDVSGPDTFDGARSVSAADIDGDGDVDVAGAALDGGEMAWFENDGKGVFTKRPLSAAVGGVDGPYGTAVADLDGDGLLDILAADWYDNDIAAWIMKKN